MARILVMVKSQYPQPQSQQAFISMSRGNGRSCHTFHADKYVMPNDDGEQDRMDSQYTWAKKVSIAEINVHSSSLLLPTTGTQ